MELLIFMVLEKIRHAPYNGTYEASNGVRLIAGPTEDTLWYQKVAVDTLGQHEINRAIVEFLRK